MTKNTRTISIVIALFILIIIIYALRPKETEPIIPVTPAPVVQNTQPELRVYNEPTGTFSFGYNPDFIVVDGSKTPVRDWRLDSTTDGILLATLTIPKSYMPSTNFSEAKLTYGRSNNAKDIKNCTVPQGNDAKNPETVTIAGYPFAKFVMGDAGAGNYYNTTSYRGILDGDCYVIEYTIHSTSLGAYSPDQGITQFDNDKIQRELESVIKNTHFELASN